MLPASYDFISESVNQTLTSLEVLLILFLKHMKCLTILGRHAPFFLVRVRVWWSTDKAVHTQGGAHTRQSVATAGVLIFKGVVGAGACVERSEPKQGVVQQCTNKAVHTQGSAHTRRCTQKVVCAHRKSLVI